MGHAAFAADVAGVEVRILGGAVGGEGPAHVRQDAAYLRVVHAQHRKTVERQVLQELHESGAQTCEVAAVTPHVVRIDVGDHGDEGLQVQERGVALVRLRYQVL